MIYCQTLATDLISNLSQNKIEEMLSLHYLSALSIKKQLSNEDKFYLITDTKGKEFTKNFPYHEVLTSLDNYPYLRPFKMSIYKIYSIEVFKDETFVHFDNDVLLFKEIPCFKDTIVQSCQGNFAKTIYNNKTKHYNWIFPNYINEITHNYNPGLFGFTKDSKIRDIYYEIALKYSELNIKMINDTNSVIIKQAHLNEMQDLYLILEEGLLWYLCKKHRINVLEFLPDLYTNYPKIWGSYSKGKIRGTNWATVFNISYLQWKEQKYIHLMNYSGIIADNNTIFLPQEVFLKIYYMYTEEVTKLLNGELWKL